MGTPFAHCNPSRQKPWDRKWIWDCVGKLRLKKKELRNITGKYKYSFARTHRKAVCFCQSFTWSPLTTGTCFRAPSISFEDRSFPQSVSNRHTEQLQAPWPDSTGWKETEASGCSAVISVTADRAAGMLVTRRQKVFCSSHLFLSIHVFSCALFFLLPSYSAFSELEPECIRLWRTLLLPNFKHGVRDSALYSVLINSAEPQQALWMYVTTHLKF